MKPKNGLLDQSGSITVYSSLALLALTGLGALTLILVSVMTTRALAETAADQAALAGAGRVVAGQVHACEVASRVANAHGSVMASCSVSGFHVWVEVSHPLAPAMRSLIARLGVDALAVRAVSHAEYPFFAI